MTNLDVARTYTNLVTSPLFIMIYANIVQDKQIDQN